MFYAVFVIFNSHKSFALEFFLAKIVSKYEVKILDNAHTLQA